MPVDPGVRPVRIIAGEPGIGKTALVHTFVAQVAATENLWVGRTTAIDVEHAMDMTSWLPQTEGALARQGGAMRYWA